MNFHVFFHEFHLFFHEFHVFFMNFTCFSRIRARTGIRAPNKRKHWKFSTCTHLRKMYTNTTAQTGHKRSIQIHFREDVHQYCKSKRLRNGSPPTPPPGTWMERLQALKVLSDIYTDGTRGYSTYIRRCHWEPGVAIITWNNPKK